jgi:glycosyltransferase involved in cell wall biosynthesis
MNGLIEALRALGHEVEVVGPVAVETAALGSEGRTITWLRRHLPGFVYELLELGYSLVAFRQLERAHHQFHPDLLYERYNLFLLAGGWLKRLHGLPLLLEVNAPLVRERSQFGGLALRRLARWTERRAWRSADFVLPVTRVLAEEVRAAGVAESRIVVLPNGVPRAMIDPEFDGATVRRRLGFDDRVVLGFSGFVREWHGLDLVIDLMAESDRGQHWHLLILGDGPALPQLRERAARRGVADRVTFAGVIPRERVAMHVAAFDLALQPRVVPYASPLKLFEYMALGRAIVAPDTPNIREILADGENALLFDPGAPGGFGAALMRLSGDPVLRHHLGEGARRTLLERDLTWNGNATRVVALASFLTGRERGSGSAAAAAAVVEPGRPTGSLNAGRAEVTGRGETSEARGLDPRSPRAAADACCRSIVRPV